MLPFALRVVSAVRMLGAGRASSKAQPQTTNECQEAQLRRHHAIHLFKTHAANDLGENRGDVRKRA